MPLRPDPFLARFEPLRTLRRKPWVGYGVMALGVASSIGVRMAVGDLLAGAPFLTFYPAIILATVVGGPRVGVAAVILSGVAADYLFLPPIRAIGSTPSELLALALFGLVALMQVGVVTLLNTAIDRLWRQADNVRFVLDAEPTGLIGVDEQGLVLLVNKAVEEQFGYLRDELFGQPIEVLLPDDLRARHANVRTAFLRRPETRPMGAGRDLQGRRKDGTTMPVEVGLNSIERDGRRGALATVADISERKAIERRQQILMNEVRHRGRNLLTVVQAIALRTITDDRSTAQARKAFMGTVAALSRTHDLFIDATTAPLADIVATELSPFGDRTTIEGCDVLLTQTAAQDFALIVHELATNAVKYGALSAPEGAVSVSAYEEGAELTFIWQERGGPTVKPPKRKGFGHTILNDVAHGFSSHVLADYHPEGLRYEIRADLGRITNVVELACRRAPEAT
jgi:PAS domain S-box-containing protein